MRQRLAIRFLSSAALVTAISFGALASVAQAQDAAIVPSTPAVAFNPDRVTTFSGAFLAARTADVDHDYATSIPLYKKALLLEPGNVEIRERLMIALLMSGQFEEGVKNAEDLKNDPSVERITTIVRGLNAIREGKYDSAKSILKYTGPNDLDRMTNALLLAWTQVGAGKGKEALSSVKTLKGPDWFGIFRNYNAGAMALVIGDVEAARSALNTAVTDREGGATAPDTYMRAVMALARLEATAGNKQKALDAISVGDAMVSNYAPLKALRQSIDKGEKQVQQVTTATEGAASVLFSVGGALNRQGAEDIVALYLQVSHELDPKSADTLLLLGGIAENTEQPQRAIEFYSQVPKTSPMGRVSELQLGVILAQTGKVDEARAHLKALIESDPTDLRSYLAYGSVLSDAKDYAAMAANYDKAVEVIGNVPKASDWSIFFQRGIAYERLKDWDKAEPNFKKALELNPDQAQVLNYLGYSWVDMNRNLDEGLNMIRRAVELRPDDGYIVDSLGWAYFRLGRFAEASTELERAAELKAGDVTVNDHLGDVYWRTGRKLEARYQWQRAITMKPELADIPRIEAKIKDGLPDDPKQVADTKPADATTAPAAATQPATPVAPAVTPVEPAPATAPATPAPAAAAPATPSTPAAPAPATPAPVAPTPAAPAPVEPAPAATPAPAAPTAAPAVSPDAPKTAPLTPPEPVVNPTTAPATSAYTVTVGDTLWKIANDQLGDGHRFIEIIGLNPALKRRPDVLTPGQVLELPAKN